MNKNIIHNFYTYILLYNPIVVVLTNAKASQLGLEKEAIDLSNRREFNSTNLKDTEEDQIANAIGREVGKKYPNATEE
jgi:hypothetical protein